MTAVADRRRTGLARLSAAAWGAVAVTVASIAITCIWLAFDNAVQYGDAAQHVYVATHFHGFIQDGQIGTLINAPNYYPPTTFVVGALAMFVGGIHVGTAVIAQNLIYLPLLAVSCYQVGRRLAGPAAGLLAVVFALGAPLIIEQFHVFMLDIPQAAFVAATVWLLLASDRFERIDMSALAGVMLGLGVASKELAPVYLVGLVPVLLLRGGWRNWRGLVVFGIVAFAVGSPWYLHHHTRLDSLLSAAGPGGEVPEGARPPLVSLDNLTWYGWATLNGLLLAPLFMLAVAGVGAAVARVVRSRPRDDLTLELLVGLAGAWTALTVMPHKDMRYTISLIVFVAVIGTAWMVRLRRRPRAIAIAALVGAVLLAHVGATIGVGDPTERRLPGGRLATLGEGVPLRNQVVVYTNHNFLVSGPEDDGNVLDLFRALRDDGIRGVYWSDTVDISSPVFEPIGLLAFAEIAGLRSEIGRDRFERVRRDEAVAIRALELDEADPCVVLADGTGVWVRLGDPFAAGARNYCPLRQPPAYGP